MMPMSDGVVNHFMQPTTKNTFRWAFLGCSKVYGCMCGYDGL